MSEKEDPIRAAAEKQADNIQWLLGPQIPWPKDRMEEVIRCIESAIRDAVEREREKIADDIQSWAKEFSKDAGTGMVWLTSVANRIRQGGE